MLKDKFRQNAFLAKFLLCAALAAYFIFGFCHLADFISADEHFWLPNSGSERIENYWTAIKNGNWKETRINDKPGITLAYAAGIAMLFDDAKGQIIKSDGTFKQFDPARTKQINFLYRLPIFLLSGFFSFFFFWIIRKITGDVWIALWSVSLILLSPILLGMSQIANPDSLFWIFASASIFTFFAFLQRGEKKLAILTGIFLGLGLASKYVSVILFPFFFFMMLTYYLFYFSNWTQNLEEWRRMIIRNSVAYFSILAGGMLLFAILMPASFAEPEIFYLGTIGFPGMEPIFWSAMAINAFLILDAWQNGGRGFHFLLSKTAALKKIAPPVIYAILAAAVIFVLVSYLTRNTFTNLSEIPFDLKRKGVFSNFSLLARFTVEFRALVFALTPLVLFALLFAWIKSIFEKSRQEFLVFTLSSFFLVFYAAVLTQGLLVTARYSIVLFPLSSVLAAIAIREFFLLEKDRYNKKFLPTFFVFTGGLLILHAFSLFFQAYDTVRAGKTLAYYSGLLFLSVPFVIISSAVFAYLCYHFFPWQKIRQIPKFLISAAIIIISIINIWLIKPFYFSYTNDFLPKKYIISGAWGYGGYEAAQYLNSLPDAQNLTVWADSFGVCEFFVGKCIHKTRVNTDKYKIDYYFRSLQATLQMKFPHPMEKDPVWKLHIDDRPQSFLKIQKAKPITNENNAENYES